MNPVDPQEVDKHAGEVVRRLRTEKGWSQAELAEAMTGAGVPTHSLTVLKIEKGTRPMRLAEVRVVLDLLNGSWDELDPPTSLEDYLYDANDQLMDERGRLREALLRFIKAWTHIKGSVEMFEPYIDGVRVRGLQSFEDFIGADDGDYLAAIASQVAYAEDEWRRSRVVSKEELEQWMAELEARKAEVVAELSEARLEELGDGVDSEEA